MIGLISNKGFTCVTNTDARRPTQLSIASAVMTESSHEGTVSSQHLHAVVAVIDNEQQQSTGVNCQTLRRVELSIAAAIRAEAPHETAVHTANQNAIFVCVRKKDVAVGIESGTQAARSEFSFGDVTKKCRFQAKHLTAADVTNKNVSVGAARQTKTTAFELAIGPEREQVRRRCVSRGHTIDDVRGNKANNIQ